MLNSLTPHKFQIVNSKLLDVKRKPIKCVKCHCKSRRKYFSHAFCWNVRPFATPAANPVANATCTLNVGGGHGRLISPNLASATSHENWFNQIQVVPVAACQTCSCRDRRLRRNEDPQNGHYEPCRFDKHLDQIQHWMMQTTAVTVWQPLIQIISNLSLIQDALAQPNATLLVKRHPLLQQSEAVRKCTEFEQNSCQSVNPNAAPCFESQRFKDALDFWDLRFLVSASKGWPSRSATKWRER